MAHHMNNASGARVLRHERLRKKLSGTTERPRLCVFRSLKNIYAQIIDDENGKTLVSASSLEPDVQAVGKTLDKNKKDVAKAVGALVAQRATSAGISTVVFDRGGYQYHGRVQVLADAARERGLRF